MLKLSSRVRGPTPSPPRKLLTSKSVGTLMKQMLFYLFARKEVQVILDRLAAIEAQQRIYTQLSQTLLQAADKRDIMVSCELPEDVSLSLDLNDFRRLEQKLRDNMETKTFLVNSL